MKALSVKQPWANLIASGQKTIETRTWATDYRGPMLIVSSKKPPIPPAGYALAVADLVDCLPMLREHEPAACCTVYDGAYAWILQNVRRIRPFAVRGSLGLFEVPVGQDELDAVATSDADTHSAKSVNLELDI